MKDSILSTGDQRRSDKQVVMVAQQAVGVDLKTEALTHFDDGLKKIPIECRAVKYVLTAATTIHSVAEGAFIFQALLFWNEYNLCWLD